MVAPRAIAKKNINEIEMDTDFKIHEDHKTFTASAMATAKPGKTSTRTASPLASASTPASSSSSTTTTTATAGPRGGTKSLIATLTQPLQHDRSCKRAYRTTRAAAALRNLDAAVTMHKVSRHLQTSIAQRQQQNKKVTWRPKFQYVRNSRQFPR